LLAVNQLGWSLLDLQCAYMLRLQVGGGPYVAHCGKAGSTFHLIET
jgi:hypothetical protein